MAKDGIITRKDIIEDQALTIGTEYAKNMQPAIEANKQLVASLKEMAPLINAFRKADSQQAYIALKQQENLKTLEAINANKLLEASELSLEKIKKAKLETLKQEEGEEFTKVNIDEVLAFYCTVLGGLDFDYNTVTYTKVMALQKQVSEKIKAIEEINKKK